MNKNKLSILTICMDLRHYIEGKKPDSKDNIQYESICMKFKNRPTESKVKQFNCEAIWGGGVD